MRMQRTPVIWERRLQRSFLVVSQRFGRRIPLFLLIKAGRTTFPDAQSGHLRGPRRYLPGFRRFTCKIENSSIDFGVRSLGRSIRSFGVNPTDRFLRSSEFKTRRINPFAKLLPSPIFGVFQIWKVKVAFAFDQDRFTRPLRAPSAKKTGSVARRELVGFRSYLIRKVKVPFAFDQDRFHGPCRPCRRKINGPY